MDLSTNDLGLWDGDRMKRSRRGRALVIDAIDLSTNILVARGMEMNESKKGRVLGPAWECLALDLPMNELVLGDGDVLKKIPRAWGAWERVAMDFPMNENRFSTRQVFSNRIRFVNGISLVFPTNTLSLISDKIDNPQSRYERFVKNPSYGPSIRRMNESLCEGR
jgi:hypothetical protein